MNRLSFLGLMLIFVGSLTAPVEAQTKNAPNKNRDPISQRLLPLYFLMWNREDLELSQEQYDKLRSDSKEIGLQLMQINKERKEAMDSLAKLLDKETLDLEAATDKYDEVLAAELQSRTLGMEMMLKARAELTPEQYKKALKLRQDTKPGAEMKNQKRLQNKMKQAQDELKRRSAAGDYPREASLKLRDASRLYSQGKRKAAEAEFDKILEMLDLDPKKKVKPESESKP